MGAPERQSDPGNPAGLQDGPIDRQAGLHRVSVWHRPAAAAVLDHNRGPTNTQPAARARRQPAWLHGGVGAHNGSTGAKRSDAGRLRVQMERLFRATISFEIANAQSQRWLDMQIAPEGELWWDFHDPAQQGLWRSWIELNHRFFEAITNAPVPVDMRVLKALKRSPLALDLYALVSYRAFVATQSGRAQFVTWEQLMEQLGTDYANVADFRRKAKVALRKIKAVFPGLILGDKQGGIQILPGASAVPPKRSRRKAKPAGDQSSYQG